MSTETSIQTENRMGTMPIPKLVFSISFPMMVSMLVQALYNIVDSMFVAKLSEEALTAVSLCFPVHVLMIAVSVGLCVGMNALLSKNLGEKKFTQANEVGKNGLFLNLVSSLCFALLGFFGSRFYFQIQTSNQEIISLGTSYLSIVTMFGFCIFSQITFERLLQSTGNSFYSMISQSIGAILNILLDPILIFGYWGFPKLGVAGAAIASAIGQLFALGTAIYLNQKYNKEISLFQGRFRPHLPTIKSICAIGVPSIIMQSIGAIMVFGLNRILLFYSSTATAVLGIYFKLQSFVFMPVFGLANGALPIVAYNYGAKNPGRIRETIRVCYVVATSLLVFGFLLFQGLSPFFLRTLFHASENMMSTGIPAMRIISISFLFAGYSIISAVLYQALGNSLYSLFASFLRQICVILPAAYLLGRYFGLTAIWWAFPISEIVTFLTFLFLNQTLLHKKLSTL